MKIRFQQVAGIRHIDGKRFDRCGARAYRDDAERERIQLLKEYAVVRIIKQGPMHFSLWVHGKLGVDPASSKKQTEVPEQAASHFIVGNGESSNGIVRWPVHEHHGQCGCGSMEMVSTEAWFGSKESAQEYCDWKNGKGWPK